MQCDRLHKNSLINNLLRNVFCLVQKWDPWSLHMYIECVWKIIYSGLTFYRKTALAIIVTFMLFLCVNLRITNLPSTRFFLLFFTMFPFNTFCFMYLVGNSLYLCHKQVIFVLLALDSRIYIRLQIKRRKHSLSVSKFSHLSLFAHICIPVSNHLC